MKIAKEAAYRQHLNQHDLIYIDFIRIPGKCDSYQDYIQRIEDGLIQNLLDEFKDARITTPLLAAG